MGAIEQVHRQARVGLQLHLQFLGRGAPEAAIRTGCVSSGRGQAPKVAAVICLLKG